MAGSSSTQQSFRKALGALKDSTKVGLAKVNSDYKELDVAIVKATNHVERVAKEKHVRFIFQAVSATRPRADVAYCIHSLSKRLAKTHNWAVALKTLFVIHRALREVDVTFLEELSNYSKSRGHMLNLSHFKDDSNPQAWDYSAWVRIYALYLEERLQCYHILKYDVEAGRAKTRDLDTDELLEQLPALQQLLFRLLACLPEGAATHNIVILNALSLVASESVKLYTAINDGILNLVDKFFEMQKHDAVRALEIYKKAGSQTEMLSEFYEKCRGLELGRGQKFIKLEKPPASFVTAMEEYVKEAPRPLVIQRNLANDDRGATPKAGLASHEFVSVDKTRETDEVEEKPVQSSSPEDPQKDELIEAPVNKPIIDLLGFDEVSHDAPNLDENNSLADALMGPENATNTTSDLSLTGENAGWELALVTNPTSNSDAVTDTKVVGGLDKLTLDGLYEDAILRRANPNGPYQMGPVASNPFEISPQSNQDPFFYSNNIPPPLNVQMVEMNQQQHAFMQEQHQQQQMMSNQESTNPFGNPFLG